eukprot:6765500-Lingulodinium_polyedra.AAC.1
MYYVYSDRHALLSSCSQARQSGVRPRCCLRSAGCAGRLRLERGHFTVLFPPTVRVVDPKM